MVFRFFLFIWGALLLTLILFASIIAFFNWPIPEHAQRLIAGEIVKRQLTYIATAEGMDRAAEVWELEAPLHPGLKVSFDPSCQFERIAGDDLDSCVMVEDTMRLANRFPGFAQMFAPLAMGAVISAFGAIALSNWLTRPIRAVNRALKSLASGLLSTRIGPDLRTSNRQLRELGEAFDHAASRLEALTETQQRLFHDISHEIRSPLARLRAAAGLLEKNPQRYQPMLVQMESDISRLDHLVESILILARFESGESEPAFVSLDLRDLIEPILQDASFEGQERGITVSYDGEDQLPLQGDIELLQRAVENVVRNSVKYSPNGGTILARGTREGKHVRLEILDDGPGVAPEDLKRIFAPFLRTGAFRQTPGLGLGLAIASRAVEAHGGRVEASMRKEGGLAVAIVLPSRI